ncbi:MAG: putative glycoside hydrolase [bacterium]
MSVKTAIIPIITAPALVWLFFIFAVPQELATKKITENSSLQLEQEEVGQLKLLFQPPEIVRAVYLTGNSAASKNKIDYLINLASTTEINAVVIDVKDYSGVVRFPEPGLIEKLHSNNIYVIARITVFQDPVLAKARPDLAIQSSSTASVWLDKQGLAWIDPASREAWDYNIAIARAALFDEVNFDYVRFPSDGNLKDMVFPYWDANASRELTLRSFFQYVREELAGSRISVDLFGLSTIRSDDMGIGQIIEDGYEYFDYVSPMVYPSHYATGSFGFLNPNEHPYEVIKTSLDAALSRLVESGKTARLRPWLQDFNLGVNYDGKMVGLEIKAVKDALGKEYAGYMLWSPTNIYTKDALSP